MPIGLARPRAVNMGATYTSYSLRHVPTLNEEVRPEGGKDHEGVFKRLQHEGSMAGPCEHSAC